MMGMASTGRKKRRRRRKSRRKEDVVAVGSSSEEREAGDESELSLLEKPRLETPGYVGMSGGRGCREANWGSSAVSSADPV